jgi:AcrR family transcriptional regulator
VKSAAFFLTGQAPGHGNPARGAGTAAVAASRTGEPPWPGGPVAAGASAQATGPGNPGQPPESLRERKKRLTRAAIFSAARRLFAERGFDDVTVAEIADAANISVKTLFTYVRSKEELAFGDGPTVLDAIVAAVRDRRVGQTPLVAAAKALLEATADAPASQLRRSASDNSKGADGYSASGEMARLGAFCRMAHSSPEAASRLRALWDETEDQLTSILAKPGDGPRERAARRLEAAQIMVLVRTVTSQEVAALIAEASVGAPGTPRPQGTLRAQGTRSAASQEALREWIRDAAGSLARGLQATRR